MTKRVFHEAQFLTRELLEEIQRFLGRCVEDGMLDVEDAYYNELLGLIEETKRAKGWEELTEVITKAKTLEVDIAAWLAGHGKTTLSLPWPTIPSE